MTSRSLMLAIAMGFSLFGTALAAYHEFQLSTSFSSLLEQGLGKVSPASLIRGPFVSHSNLQGAAQIWHVLFANMFQLLISFEYLFYNNILTCQVVGDEFVRYLTERKALRVSSPRNAMQRFSYFLSLPWKYAGPQMLAFIVLHWLVSQSVFTVQTSGYSPGPNGQRVPSVDASRVGFSALGILLSTLLGALLLVGLLGLSIFRRYPEVPEYFPRMAVNSAAISANCHRPLKDDDASLFPLRLGVVRHDIDLMESCEGRITFSTDREIETPVPGVEYEMASWTMADGDKCERPRGVDEVVAQSNGLACRK